jgi:hypothetical protein
MTDRELMDLYPDGRTYYDETDDPAGFMAACHSLDLSVAVNHPPASTGLEPYATVYVPPKKLGDFERLGLRVGT